MRTKFYVMNGAYYLQGENAWTLNQSCATDWKSQQAAEDKREELSVSHALRAMSNDMFDGVSLKVLARKRLDEVLRVVAVSSGNTKGSVMRLEARKGRKR